MKNALGKLPLLRPLSDLMEHWASNGDVKIPNLTLQAVRQLPSLPSVHRDPLDRMLVCQALALHAEILSPDLIFDAYDVPRIW